MAPPLPPEYDLVVQPGRDPAAIRMRFEGQRAMRVDGSGDLVLETTGGEIRHRRPHAWQQTKEGRREIAASYFIADRSLVSFRLGAYDRNLPVVIDPVISVSTYFPLSMRAIGTDAAGNIYVAGEDGQWPNQLLGPVAGPKPGYIDTLVAKLDPEGKQLLFATYIGGNNLDTPFALIVDAAGNIFVSGNTQSENFPSTLDTRNQLGQKAIFVVKLSPAGTRVYSVLLRGGEQEGPDQLAVDSSGSVYVAGTVKTPDDFPFTPQAFSGVRQGGSDGVVAKLTADGTIAWATAIGGSGGEQLGAIARDSGNNIYVSGATASADFPTSDGSVPTGNWDGFLSKLKADGSALLFSSRFGGSEMDWPRAMTVDSAGSVYVAGDTQSPDFPRTPGTYVAAISPSGVNTLAFLAKYSSSGARIYSTYFGAVQDIPRAVYADGSGSVWLAGTTRSSQAFPLTPGALMGASNAIGDLGDLFLTQFDASGSSIVYSTLFGGLNEDSLADAAFVPGAVYLAANSYGDDLPTTAGAYLPRGPNGFLLKIDLTQPANCFARVSPSSVTMPPAGGPGSFDVDLPDGCPWVASAPYQITLTPPVVGMGKTRISYWVRPLPAGYPPDTLKIKMADAEFAISRSRSSCSDVLFDPPSVSLTAFGGMRTVTASVPGDCQWQVASNAPWLSATPNQASATIQVFAQPNSSAARSGSITINGKSLPVTQAAGACTQVVSPAGASVPAAGGSGSITVTITGGCSFTAVSQSDWLTVTASGSNVTYTAAPNPGWTARTGTILIESQPVAIAQAAGPAAGVTSYNVSTYAGITRSLTGDGGPVSAAGIAEPHALARDSAGNLFISDLGRVRRVGTDGIISSIAGGGSNQDGENIPALTAFILPVMALATDAAGNVYVAEAQGNRVRKVGLDGNIVTIAGTLLNPASSGDGGPATAAKMVYPLGVAVGSDGSVFIAETGSHRIRKVGPDGIIRAFAGTGTAGFAGEGGPALSAQFRSPSALVLDAAGNLYVSDSGNHRIRRIDAQTGIIVTVAGSGSAGFGGDGGPAAAAKLSDPAGIDVDPQGNLYITDKGNVRIRKVSGGIITTIAGTGESCRSCSSGETGPATTAKLSSPEGVLAWPTADVFVADTWNFIVRKLTPATLASGVPCNVSVTPSTLATMPASGGSVTMRVSAAAGCSWTATSPAAWVTAEPLSGTGDGSVTLHVAEGTLSGPRSATIGFGSASITLRQDNGLRFVPMTPCRVVDTRLAEGPFGGPGLWSGSRSFALDQGSCSVPASALAYSLNVTAVPAGPLGYLTIWPGGTTQPVVSTLNSLDGRIKAAAALVEKGPAGVSVYGSAKTDVVIDINGYFVPANDPAGLAFYPVTPCRVADTRLANGPLGGPGMGAAQTRNFPVDSGACGIPASAKAYVMNVTVVPPGPLGYLSAWPAGAAQPTVSTLNALNGGITANAAIVPAGVNGAISIYTSASTQVAIDVSGYFAPPDGSANALSFYPAAPCRAVDTRLAPGPLGSPSIWGQRDLPLGASMCGMTSNARAYSLNATVVPPARWGIFRYGRPEVRSPPSRR